MHIQTSMYYLNLGKVDFYIDKLWLNLYLVYYIPYCVKRMSTPAKDHLKMWEYMRKFDTLTLNTIRDHIFLNKAGFLGFIFHIGKFIFFFAL